MFFYSEMQKKPSFIEIIGAVCLGLFTAMNPLCLPRQQVVEESNIDYTLNEVEQKKIVKNQNGLSDITHAAMHRRGMPCCGDRYHYVIDEYINTYKAWSNKSSKASRKN